MSKLLRIFSALCLLCLAASAQDEKSPTAKFLNRRGYYFQQGSDTIEGGFRKWPDTLYYNTTYRAKLLGSPTIPISFSKIESVNGKFQVTPSISIGLGYTWFFGDFSFSETDRITVDPNFFFGVIGDFGLQNDFSLNKLTSVFTGVFIGVAQFSLFAGWDYLTSSGVIGLGGRIDLYTLHQSSLKPFGAVRPERKPKTGALPIHNE